jgi:hypothetical protein
MKPLIISGIILSLLLSACGAALPPAPSSLQSIPATVPAPAVTPTLLIFPTPLPEQPTLTLPVAATPTAAERASLPLATSSSAIAAAEPTYANLPDFVEPLRLPADKWQQWPVVPAVTARARQIYAQGIRQGTNPHAFAKVGDCQSVNVAFFGVYDQPKVYQLPKDYEYLQQTIDWFAGYFNRESAAVRGGFNVASVFVPLQADPKVCQAGETPLACEFRLTNPSLVMLSMETGFEGRTAAVYEKYMRQIIQFSIDHGAVPILATKADNFEGDQSINLTTARLAVEYDLPLWNFWRAVQPLPNHGMDAERPDNFHTSVEAWNVRSFTGLQALDAIRRAVQAK